MILDDLFIVMIRDPVSPDEHVLRITAFLEGVRLGNFVRIRGRDPEDVVKALHLMADALGKAIEIRREKGWEK